MAEQARNLDINLRDSFENRARVGYDDAFQPGNDYSREMGATLAGRGGNVDENASAAVKAAMEQINGGHSREEQRKKEREGSQSLDILIAQQQLARLQERIDYLDREIERLNREINRLERRIAQNERQMATLDAEIRTYTTHLAILNNLDDYAAYNDVGSMPEDVREEYNRHVHAAVGAGLITADDVDQGPAHVAAVAQTRSAAIRDDLGSAQDRRSDLAADTDRANTQKAEAEDQRDDLERQIDGLRQASDNLEEAIESGNATRIREAQRQTTETFTPVLESGLSREIRRYDLEQELSNLEPSRVSLDVYIDRYHEQLSLYNQYQDLEQTILSRLENDNLTRTDRQAYQEQLVHLETRIENTLENIDYYENEIEVNGGGSSAILDDEENQRGFFGRIHESLTSLFQEKSQNNPELDNENPRNLNLSNNI